MVNCNLTDDDFEMIKTFSLMSALIVFAACGPTDAGAPAVKQDATAEQISSQMHDAANAARYEDAIALATQLQEKYPASPQADTAKKTRVTMDSLRVAAQTAAEAERERAFHAAKWDYTATQDAMTSSTTHMARISSENTVEFSFPYSGAQHGTLILRTHPTYGRDVILTIEKGQILCPSYDSCRLRVRFDSSPPTSWTGVGPSDNSNESVFIRDYATFVKRLRKSKTIRIQIPVFQEGEPVFEFDVSGFEFAKYAGDK